MGKTIDDLKHIYGKIHWCHRKIRYLWEKRSMSYKNTISKGKPLMSYKYLCVKPLMSYKNTISVWKTSRCDVKIRYLWGKQVDVIQKYDIYGENKSMSYKNTIYIGKTIDVLKDIDGPNHWCHIKLQYLWEKPLMSYKIFVGKTIDVI